MCAWAKKSTGGSGMYLRFAAGEAYEGVYKSFTTRPSPFAAGKELYDFTIEINGEDKILSTSSDSLKAIIPNFAPGTRIRIEMLLKSGRKIYDVYAEE